MEWVLEVEKGLIKAISLLFILDSFHLAIESFDGFFLAIIFVKFVGVNLQPWKH
jgi:hypothetical protein